jgi:hypothetical protein
LLHLLGVKDENGSRLHESLTTVCNKRGQPHHAMEPPPSAILSILSLALSTSLPNQSSFTSDILSVLPLCHNQPPINSANNIPPPALQITYPLAVPQITYPTQNNPQVKSEINPPPPPLPQIQEAKEQNKAFPTHGTILSITGGYNTDFETKRQQWHYYREVNHVAVEDPITQTKWSHIPIAFFAKDVNLTSFPHTDSLVMTVHIDQWDVSKILVNNGSQVEILFLSTFMKQLKEPMEPLYGFGSKKIESVGVITLPISFGTQKPPTPNT